MSMPTQTHISGARNMFWWAGFLLPAVALQRFFPGVDFLLAGFLLTLQERRYRDIIWVLPLLVVLQEGMGTREFGVVLLWYVVVASVFLLGRWLFDVETFLYAFLFSSCLAACYFAVAFLMSPLCAVSVDVDRLLDESLHLALLLPVCWKLAQFTRRGIYAGDTE
jgi:hypothetical protein